MFHPSERIALAALERPASQQDWLRLLDAVHDERGFWWLDSASLDTRLGRLSFAGAHPYLWLRSRGTDVELEVERGIRPGLCVGRQQSTADPFETARALLPRADSILYSTCLVPHRVGPDRLEEPARGSWHEVAGLSDGLDLPFLGGAVGYFGYELAAQIEDRRRFENLDDLGLPEMSLAFVDQVFAYDHRAERLWLLGLGFAGGDAEGRASVGADARARAVSRSRVIADALDTRVTAALTAEPESSPSSTGSGARSFSSQVSLRASSRASLRGSSEPQVESTIDAAGYAKAVDTILEEIEKGNVYQANFSQRLSALAPGNAWTLYTRLRRANPAPFGAFLSQPDGIAILSSSPERFLELDPSRRVESRPIKGTRPRGDNEVEDARLARELATSEKDQAENLMIVDLVRNDLGRVCKPGTISVPELMKIEPYAAVFQMVSTVTGQLAKGRDAFDLIRATFPPGSMTGAPKLASMDLLEQLETVRRGVYAGALGYLDLRGGLDLSVVIRTFVWKDGMAHLHVGGGVVADSSPEGEYFESLDKARAPLSALSEAAKKR
jgi:para-aminobenzoate synthetase component 1